MRPSRGFLVLGAVLAALGVAAGAFGAHALAGRVPAERLAIFETAARYHLVHALALVLVGVLAERGLEVRAAGWLLLAGVVVFSGSLYLLVLSGASWLGAVTPLGGAAFITGWLALAWAAWRGAGVGEGSRPRPPRR